LVQRSKKVSIFVALQKSCVKLGFARAPTDHPLAIDRVPRQDTNADRILMWQHFGDDAGRCLGRRNLFANEVIR
jgi:hypothetical protein